MRRDQALRAAHGAARVGRAAGRRLPGEVASAADWLSQRLPAGRRAAAGCQAPTLELLCCRSPPSFYLASPTQGYLYQLALTGGLQRARAAPAVAMSYLRCADRSPLPRLQQTEHAFCAGGLERREARLRRELPTRSPRCSPSPSLCSVIWAIIADVVVFKDLPDPLRCVLRCACRACCVRCACCAHSACCAAVCLGTPGNTSAVSALGSNSPERCPPAPPASTCCSLLGAGVICLSSGFVAFRHAPLLAARLSRSPACPAAAAITLPSPCRRRRRPPLLPASSPPLQPEKEGLPQGRRHAL